MHMHIIGLYHRTLLQRCTTRAGGPHLADLNYVVP